MGNGRRWYHPMPGVPSIVHVASTAMPRTPLVGLPADSQPIEHHRYQTVGEKYVQAVVLGAEALPVLIPSMQPPLPMRELVASLDGLLLTGAYSNIEPHHYDGGPSYEGNLHDPARDANTLPLVMLAVELDVPVLAVGPGPPGGK